MPVPGAVWEVVRPPFAPRRFRAALFDFDGTLSLIREGWQNVMVPMMVEALLETGTTETPEELHSKVASFVARLTGRQTIYQMIRLAEEIQARGGTPLEALAYKHRYNLRLGSRIQERVAELETGKAVPADWTVPESHALLEGLQRRGVRLYLASGTDIAFVRQEARLLGLDRFFGEHIYGALDDYKSFSKAMIVDRLVREEGLGSEDLLGFGDGYVEIEEIKRVGGTAIGVASDEAGRKEVDAWKRARLIEAGADVLIPHYRGHEALLAFLFGE